MLGAFLDTLTQISAGKALTPAQSAPRWLSGADLTKRIKDEFDGEKDLTGLRLAVRSSLYSQGATSQAAAAQAYANVEKSFAASRG
jgi:hypothetical protein